MKKIVLLTLLVSSFLMFSVFTTSSLVKATDVINDVCSQPTATGEKPAVCNDNLSDPGAKNPITGPEGIVTKGVQLFTIVLALTAIVVLMINGIKFITSSGEASSVTSARNGVLYAVIGLVIALSAQLIVSFVLKKL